MVNRRSGVPVVDRDLRRPNPRRFTNSPRSTSFPWAAPAAVDDNVFAITSTLPDVQPSVLQAACDPASPRLPAWPIYRGIVAACGAGEAEARKVFTCFLAAKAEHDDAGDVVDKTVRGELDLPAPPASPDGASSIDPPTVPRLREITGRADFAHYLKVLVDETGLGYRAIGDATRGLNRKAVSCRSTLSENLRNHKAPTKEAVVETLLSVLYARLAGTVATAEPVRGHSVLDHPSDGFDAELVTRTLRQFNAGINRVEVITYDQLIDAAERSLTFEDDVNRNPPAAPE